MPFFCSGDTAIWVVIALVSVRGFAGYFSVPAWTSLTADVVPIGMRGRFFASRNFGMSLAALATAPVAGFLLDRYSGLAGWQIVWALATAAAALSTWCYAQIPDPNPHVDVLPRERAAGDRGVFAEILSDGNFVWYLVGTAMWNVALQAAGPFFNVYLAKNLGASSLWIGFLSALPAVTGLVGLVYFGKMMDTRGTKWMMVVCGLLIPLLPAMWVFIDATWQVIFPNAASGILWAGYNLAILNMVMVMAPPETPRPLRRGVPDRDVRGRVRRAAARRSDHLADRLQGRVRVLRRRPAGGHAHHLAPGERGAPRRSRSRANRDLARVASGHDPAKAHRLVVLYLGLVFAGDDLESRLRDKPRVTGAVVVAEE